MPAMKFSDKQQTERRVLKAIYHLTLETPDRETYLKDVQGATGFGLKEIQDACKTLQKAGHIERTNFRIALTDAGVAHSEKLIAQGRL